MSRMTMDFQRQMDEFWKKKSTETRAEKKTRKKLTKAQVIAKVRPQVFALDKACICGTCKASGKDQMHEVQSRAELRGKPPEVIFCVENCVRVSRRCHSLITGELTVGKAMTLRFLDPVQRAMGPIEITRDGKTWTVERGAP